MMELWPFTNFHDLNLDWIIKTIKTYTKKVDDFIEDMTGAWDTFKNIINHEIAEMHRKFAIYVNVTEEALNSGAIADGAITFPKLNDTIKIFVTPEMYGATGDGVSDDTQAIQDAVDSGYPVIFKNDYAVSEPVILISDTSLISYENSEIKAIDNGSTYYAIFKGTDVENIQIEGLHLRGLKHWTGLPISSDDNDRGILIKGTSKNIDIRNCKFEDFGAAAMTVIGDYLNITNNEIVYTGTFTGATPNYNFGIDYVGANITINDNVIDGVIQGVISGLTNKNAHLYGNNIKTASNGQHGFYMEGCDNVTIENNVIDAAICGVKYQLHDLTITTYERGTIKGNHITAKNQGVLITDLDRVGIVNNFVVEGNTIYSEQRCVELSVVNNIVITNNIMNITSDTPTTYIVRSDEANKVVINNNLCKGTQYGIYFTADQINENETISNNTIEMVNTNNAGSALLIARSDMVTIVGNNIHQNGTNTNADGVYFDVNSAADLQRVTFTGNVVYGFRWDARATGNPNIEQAGNSLGTHTGL